MILVFQNIIRVKKSIDINIMGHIYENLSHIQPVKK